MLSLIFFLIASVYSIAGFGGGSSYLAFLAYFKTPYDILPTLGLICNLIVVFSSGLAFSKRGEINNKLTLPLILISSPMSFLGGLIPLKENSFFLLLSGSLFLTSIKLLATQPKTQIFNLPYSQPKLLLLGALIGFLAGMVSIGGGIFLSPILLSLGWGHPREIASTASLFILFNSLFGLAGQMTKNLNLDFLNYWPLFLAVFFGSLIGIKIRNSYRLTPLRLQQVTGFLILIISLNIFLKRI
jgi:uncharacterized membrane protein YfcA